MSHVTSPADHTHTRTKVVICWALMLPTTAATSTVSDVEQVAVRDSTPLSDASRVRTANFPLQSLYPSSSSQVIFACTADETSNKNIEARHHAGNTSAHWPHYTRAGPDLLSARPCSEKKAGDLQLGQQGCFADITPTISTNQKRTAISRLHELHYTTSTY